MAGEKLAELKPSKMSHACAVLYYIAHQLAEFFLPKHVSINAEYSHIQQYILDDRGHITVYLVMELSLMLQCKYH